MRQLQTNHSSLAVTAPNLAEWVFASVLKDIGDFMPPDAYVHCVFYACGVVWCGVCVCCASLYAFTHDSLAALQGWKRAHYHGARRRAHSEVCHS